MTNEQEIVLSVEEIGDLIGSLKKHANVSKISGYFEAAYDIMLACKKLENLSLLLQSQPSAVSQ